MSKKILVAVIGSTPQILTETIYALYDERKWVPDCVYVLTTVHGKKGIEKNLFEKGQFQALCNEYDLHNILFNSDSIQVICDGSGNELNDIKSVDDNDYAANMIVTFIHDLCQDANNELHVSLAGGRKSMGFYIGYALSLFGRAQDSMSHVLVSDPYDAPGDFYFPTKESSMVDIYPHGYKNLPVKVDAKEAKIWLADIPFVRMGVGYSPLKLTDEQSYRQAVTLTQTAVSDFRVTLNISDYTLDCSGFAKIKLQPNELSIYQLFIELAQKGEVFSIDHDIPNSCDWEEFSDKYLALQKQYGRNNDDFTEMNKDQIRRKVRECSSKLKKQLEENNLGPYVDNFGILSMNNGKYFQLAIAPENITVIK